jgi:hypothetical protein
VDINEARRDHHSGGINDSLCWTSQAAGECSDTPVAYGDIDSTTWRTTAIDNLGTANDEVVHAMSPLFFSGIVIFFWEWDCSPAASYGMRIVIAAALYGSAQREETQHREDSDFCHQPPWSSSSSSLALNVPIS